MRAREVFRNSLPDVWLLAYLFWHPHRSRRERTSLAMTEGPLTLLFQAATHTRARYKTCHYDIETLDTS